ncbi:hypothetical protein MMC09_001421 [Bachmanniomyces sp. S44760]|nr:hypothetical protein [Bachmanniomyces sp. S44760]
MSGVVKDVGAFWKMTATPVIQRSIASIHVKFKQLRKGYGAQVEDLKEPRFSEIPMCTLEGRLAGSISNLLDQRAHKSFPSVQDQSKAICCSSGRSSLVHYPSPLHPQAEPPKKPISTKPVRSSLGPKPLRVSIPESTITQIYHGTTNAATKFDCADPESAQGLISPQESSFTPASDPSALVLKFPNACKAASGINIKQTNTHSPINQPLTSPIQSSSPLPLLNTPTPGSCPEAKPSIGHEKSYTRPLTDSQISSAPSQPISGMARSPTIVSYPDAADTTATLDRERRGTAIEHATPPPPAGHTSRGKVSKVPILIRLPIRNSSMQSAPPSELRFINTSTEPPPAIQSIRYLAGHEVHSLQPPSQPDQTAKLDQEFALKKRMESSYMASAFKIREIEMTKMHSQDERKCRGSETEKIREVERGRENTFRDQRAPAAARDRDGVRGRDRDRVNTGSDMAVGKESLTARIGLGMGMGMVMKGRRHDHRSGSSHARHARHTHHHHLLLGCNTCSTTAKKTVVTRRGETDGGSSVSTRLWDGGEDEGGGGDLDWEEKHEQKQEQKQNVKVQLGQRVDRGEGGNGNGNSNGNGNDDNSVVNRAMHWVRRLEGRSRD